MLRKFVIIVAAAFALTTGTAATIQTASAEVQLAYSGCSRAIASYRRAVRNFQSSVRRYNSTCSGRVTRTTYNWCRASRKFLILRRERLISYRYALLRRCRRR